MSAVGRLSVQIERLVLEGVRLDPAQRSLLQNTVETELTRLLEEGGLATRLSGGAALPRITSPAIEFDIGNRPTGLGHQIAGAVYRGIGV